MNETLQSSYLPTIYDLDKPNVLQMVNIRRDTTVCPENPRLFIEKEKLGTLLEIYTAWKTDPNVVLPDPPILWARGGKKLEVLAGERRTTAAIKVGVTYLPCRIVSMSPEEAYRFVLRHNDVAGLTTAERAFRAAEMARLGFSEFEIGEELGGVAAYRYITVGMLMNSAKFTDDPKLCDPSITHWFDAAKLGQSHFDYCFHMWNFGQWDDKQCEKNFRLRGRMTPSDNTEKGFRVTYNHNRLVVRGRVDLTETAKSTVEALLQRLKSELDTAVDVLDTYDNFGLRSVTLINKDTVNI